MENMLTWPTNLHLLKNVLNQQKLLRNKFVKILIAFQPTITLATIKIFQIPQFVQENNSQKKKKPTQPLTWQLD